MDEGSVPRGISTARQVTNQNTRKEYYFVRQGWIEEGGIGVGFGVSVKIHAMTKDEFS